VDGYGNADTSRNTRVPKRRHLQLEEYFPYLINRAGAALVERFSRDTLAPRGLSIATWRVLAVLANDGGSRLTDISGKTSIELSTLSRLVTRLIRDGYVSRSRAVTSNREITVQLSPKGRTLVAELTPVAEDLQRAAIDGLTKAELKTVKRALTRVYQNLAGE
jgi:DNA-binding MarR family transcriptional regulator